jgi:Protein of unknown function (DUF3379)
MNHEQFEHEIGADPEHPSEAARAHLAECADCARLHAELVALNARVRTALLIPVPAAAAPIPLRRPLVPYGLAAAAALGAVLLATLFVAAPRDALARAVAVHADHEPAAFSATLEVPDATVRGILAQSHVELLAGGPAVAYASSCPLRGHTVPHLAVRAAHGNVVVMVLPEERVTTRQSFAENGYRGVLVPAARGSIAILSPTGEDLDEVISQVASRIRYLD